MIKFLLCLLMIMSFKVVSGQDLIPGAKIWESIGLSAKISKKWKVEFENVQSYNLNRPIFSYSQTSLKIKRRVKYHLNIGLEGALGVYSWQNSYSRYGLTPIAGVAVINRISVNVEHKFKVLKIIRFKQRLQSQFFFPKLDKYQFRFVYRFKAYFSTGIKWDLKPFVEPMIYFYLNGVPSLYRNDHNIIETYKSPNGFHRLRLKGGIQFKPLKNVKKLGLSVYFMYQKEFNISGVGHDLNVVKKGSSDILYPFSPSKSNILNPFNDYSVLGIHAQYNL